MHSANISKIIWPSKEETRSEILEALGLPSELSLRNRRLRNHLEHYDERLEEWYRESKYHIYVDLNLVPPNAIAGIDPRDMLRNLDPTTLRFLFRGEEYDLKRLYQEIDTIHKKATEWLQSHEYGT